MKDITKKDSETPYIIRDMDKELGNPQSSQELLDAIQKMWGEKFYDLHQKELSQIQFGIYRNFKWDSLWDYDVIEKLGDLFDHKDNIEKILSRLAEALVKYNVEFSDEWVEFDKKAKGILVRILQLFDKYKKVINPEDSKKLAMDQYIWWWIMKYNEIRFSIFAEMLNMLLKYIYNKDELDKALSKLIKINGEDIYRPILWWNDIEKADWNSILFTKYGAGYINIDDLLKWLQKNLDKNKDKINQLVKPFLEIYEWLRLILENTNHDKSEANNTVQEINIPQNINIKEITGLYNTNQYLTQVIQSDKYILEEKLKVWKDIFGNGELAKMIESQN